MTGPAAAAPGRARPARPHCRDRPGRPRRPVWVAVTADGKARPGVPLVPAARAAHPGPVPLAAAGGAEQADPLVQRLGELAVAGLLG